MKRIGGSELFKMDINEALTHPFGPKRALNPAATTTVGITNGTPVMARRKDFPGKSNLPSRKAPGNPRAKVRIVDINACQMVKLITLLIVGDCIASMTDSNKPVLPNRKLV
jgi:hypothetical protein